jgi:hypothetical protein
MTKRFILGLAVAFSLIILADLAFTSSSGPPAGHSGAPGDGTCLSCHGGQPLNPGTATRTLVFNNDATLTSYVPGQTYTAVYTVNNPTTTVFGFQLIAKNAAGANVGTLIATNAAQASLTSGYIQQTFTGRLATTAGTKSWNFSWTAPAAGTGTVSFYVATNVSNADGGSGGDAIYTNVFTLTEAAPQASVGAATVAPSVVCRGGSITVNFTTTGSFNSGNTFTAQLSDASGSFANPVTLGSITATTAAPITAPTPPAAAAGTAYRVRVVASNPAATGDSSANFSITIPAAAPTLTYDGRTLTASGTGAISWLLNGNPITGATGSTYVPTQAGNYVAAIANSGCSPSLSAPFAVSAGFVSLNSLMNPNLCEETLIMTTFVPFGTFDAGNQFSLELFDSAGIPTLMPVTITGNNVQAILYSGMRGSNFTFRLRATAPLAISELSDSFNILPRPATPTIVANGFEMSIQQPPPGALFEWHRDGTMITGANSAQFTAFANGSYKAFVTVGNCRSDASNEIVITNVSVAEQGAANFVLYPNPVADVLQINLPDAGMLSCYDLQGRLVAQQQLEAGLQSWEVLDYAPGLYVMVYESAGKLQRQRFVKR